MRGLALVAATLLSIGTAGVAGAGAVLLPVDEAALQAGFFTFRARLEVALATRDTAAVLAAVHPAIKSSFGGDAGLEEFRRTWNLSDPASPFWGEMATVLSLGGTFADESTFVAPYVFSRWPDGFDAFTHEAILGERVNVRASASTDAAVLATLDFAIVERAPSGRRGPEDPEWPAIRLGDGRTGYVSRPLLRSPIALRAIFARQAGRWRLVTLVAGD